VAPATLSAVPVPRETITATVQRFEVPDPEGTTEAIRRLLDALAAEPDPPTTVRDPAQALDTHIADSLAGVSVLQLRRARRIADIGAGAGFPGLVLAAALPEAVVDLIEATRRKCEVIERLAAAAGLQARARALPVRAEDLARGQGRVAAYDAVTARALAPLPVICEYAAPLLRLGGTLVAWKGDRKSEEEEAGERAASELGLEPAAVVEYRAFSETRPRHLYVYSKVTNTPSRYPRRVGVARKKPIA
jgi:16S rRNA (guanine527-N7)-methyltransferase